MSENEHIYQHNEVHDRISPIQDHKPYWKRMHHSVSFWIFLFLMFVAIIYYIVSLNFAFAPY